MGNTIHRRCKFIFGVVFLTCPMLSASSIWVLSAFASATETYNLKTYGNCIVFDSVDRLTDEATHILSCWEGDEFYELITPHITFVFDPGDGREIIFLNAEAQYVPSDDLMNVLIRVDSGKLRRAGMWNATEHGTAFSSALITKGIRDNGFCFRISDEQGRSFLSLSIDKLLSEMAMGYRIAFQVGDQRSSIGLRGSAAAISDYESRIKRYANCYFRKLGGTGP